MQNWPSSLSRSWDQWKKTICSTDSAEGQEGGTTAKSDKKGPVAMRSSTQWNRCFCKKNEPDHAAREGGRTGLPHGEGDGLGPPGVELVVLHRREHLVGAHAAVQPHRAVRVCGPRGGRKSDI